MRAYFSARSTLFPPEVAAQPKKHPYSPWAVLVSFFAFTMVFVGSAAAFQFLWPGLNSTFIRVSALGVVAGLAFAARKAGLLPVLSCADADKLPRGAYFLSSFLGMAFMWVTFSAVFENKISLDNVIGGVLFGLMWAAMMTL